jgi:quercetin dioxygenase-like cupin family protein
MHRDARGRLTAIDFRDIPFAVQRVFVITDVPAGTRRGGHSHRSGTHALFCLQGRIEVQLRGSDFLSETTLVPDGVGLEIAAGVWSEQHYVEHRSELLVLASDPYDPSVYESEVPEPS